MVNFMLKGAILVLFLVPVLTIGIGYTLTNLKEYKNENLGFGDNTTHVIVGVSLLGKKVVDAQKIVRDAFRYGVNQQQALAGKKVFFKLFGSDQNYQQMMRVDPISVASEINTAGLPKSDSSFYLIDWDHKTFELGQEEQVKTVQWLKKLLTSLPNSYLKVPADLLCRKVGGSTFHATLNHSLYIIQMYGKNNPYLTYQSIFSQKEYANQTDSYISACPKNPSTFKLHEMLPTATVHIQKTLHTEIKGYVDLMAPWIEQAGRDGVFSGVVFFDQHPINTIRI